MVPMCMFESPPASRWAFCINRFAAAAVNGEFFRKGACIALPSMLQWTQKGAFLTFC